MKALDAALAEVRLPERDDEKPANRSDDYQDPLHNSGETRPAPDGRVGYNDFRVSGDAPSWAARRADAPVVLVESFLQHGAEALCGGDRTQIVMHVDDGTLRHGEAGRCELEDGPAMPIETGRRISCDASIITITEDERGEPLRKTRSIPPALRRALASRDKGPRVARRNCPTRSRCADFTIGQSTRWNEARDEQMPGLNGHESSPIVARGGDESVRGVKVRKAAFGRPLMPHVAPDFR